MADVAMKNPAHARSRRQPHSAGLPVRLQKFLAEAGVASRRACEQIILAGRVAVNGEIIRRLGTKVQPAEVSVTVDSQPLKGRRKLYVALNKPRGYVCTRQDVHARRLIAELVPPEWRHLYSVGRLDQESEGLIFLTNDGQFALRLTHPRYGARKTYEVTVEGKVTPPVLQRLTAGVNNVGENLKAQSARLLRANHAQSVVELELAEGKHREIRRLFAALGLEVSRLQRIKIGPIRLGELPIGKWRALTEPEIKSLLPDI